MRSIDVRRSREHQAEHQQERHHDPHAEAERDDADGGERPRPAQGPRGVKQIREVGSHSREIRNRVYQG